MDHTALGVDLLGEEEKVVGPVMKDEKAGVLDTDAGHGNVGDIVDGLVNGGVGVEVLAEFHTY